MANRKSYKNGQGDHGLCRKNRKPDRAIDQLPFTAKFGGATGNFNAHHAAFPKLDWIKLANEFVEKILGLTRMQYTTQIEHYDSLAAQFDCMKRSTIYLSISVAMPGLIFPWIILNKN
jgi:Adenylosuccinate lyase